MKLTPEQKAKLPKKFFNKEAYYPAEVFDEKHKAKKWAAGIRHLGWKSRVVSCKRTGKQRWLVYARQKGPWTPFTPSL
jgi:hypothetical protein